MKLLSLPIALILFIGCSSNALEIKSPSEIPSKEQTHYESLLPHLHKIEKRLTRKLPNNEDLIANIEMAESTKISWLDDPSDAGLFNEARQWFVSLKGVDKSCDFKSYEILAINKIMVDATKKSSLKLDRIQTIVDGFVRRHALECRPQYAKLYHNLVANMDFYNNWPNMRRVLEGIAELTSGLRPSKMNATLTSLQTVSQDKTTAAESGSDLSLDAKLVLVSGKYVQLHDEALAILANRMAEWYRADSESSSSGRSHKFFLLDKELADVSEEVSGRKFNDLLLRPCETFVRHSQKVLAPARFDAALADEQQLSFLTEDVSFLNAIVNYRICKHLSESYKDYETKLIKYFDEALQKSAGPAVRYDLTDAYKAFCESFPSSHRFSLDSNPLSGDHLDLNPSLEKERLRTFIVSFKNDVDKLSGFTAWLRPLV